MNNIINSDLLVIEEKSRNGNSLQARLKRLNFKTLEVLNSLKDIDTIAGRNFDIIFYAIPKYNARKIKLLESLQRNFRDSRVILVSKKMSPNLMRKAISYGVHDFLNEPINIETIPNLVARNLEQNYVLNYHVLKKNSEILMKAIEALIAAMEAKDPYTSGHSMRVVNYAMLMAQKLNFDEEEKFTLQLSAALHDIGKIGLPDEILKNKVLIDPKRADLIREHPVIGSDIVGRIDELHRVASIIKHHHERYDGLGYPDGLKGKEIPLMSRIIAIVDAYEAIISQRSYSQSLTHAEALEELERHAGTQFDPELLSIFLAEVESIDFKPQDMFLVDERF